MRIIGLTGGIAMGKSTAAKAFRRAHVPVFDADAAVRALQAPNGAALPALRGAFPAVIAQDVYGRLALDRAALRTLVLSDPQALRRLEAIIHPMVAVLEQRFLARARRMRARLAVLDVPLLFESNTKRRLDRIVVVSAPAAVQAARVFARGILTPAQLQAILARQLPDQERRRRADIVVRSGLSRYHANSVIRRIIRELTLDHEPRCPIRHRNYRPRPADRRPSH